MLSGIGPRDELKKYGIKQVLDLPVGRNLQDHCQVGNSIQFYIEFFHPTALKGPLKSLLKLN